MEISDDALDILSLIFILGGLGLLFFFILDYNYNDAALEWKQLDRAEISGKISSKTEYYYVLSACRSFRVYSDDEYGEGEEVKFFGSLSNGIFYADSSERKI